MMPQPPPVHTPPRRRAIALFGLGILCFWAAMYVYVPIFSVYAESLGATLTIVGLGVGVYGLTQTLTRIPLGIWSDARGQRRIFVVAGMLTCAIAAAGLALSPSPLWLVIFRGVMGLAAATWVCSTVLFTSYFPQSNPAVPLSIMSFLSAFGQVLATAAGGVLAQTSGWTAPFWASMVLSLIAAGALTLVPDDSTSRPVTVTLPGMLHIAREPILIFSCAIGVIVYFATFSTVYGFTPVLAERLGATRAQLGYLTMAALLVYSLVTLTSAYLIRALGEQQTLLIGLAVFTLAILPTPMVTGIGALAILQVLNGLGRGLLYPLLMSLAIKGVASHDRASAMGVFQAAYAFGMFIGPWISGRVADVWGLSSVFLLCGGLSLGCLGASIIVVPRIQELTGHPSPTS